MANLRSKMPRDSQPNGNKAKTKSDADKANRDKSGSSRNSKTTSKKTGRFPASMNSELQELLLKEEALAKKLNTVRVALQVKRQQRDKDLEALPTDTQSKLEGLEQKILDCISKRKDVYMELSLLDGSSPQDNEAQNLQENLAILKLGLPPLREEKREIDRELKTTREKMNEMKLDAARIKSKVEILEPSEIERREQVLQKEIEKSNSNYKTCDVDAKHFQNQVYQLEKLKERAVEYWGLVDSTFKATQKVLQLEKKQKERTAELKEIEEQIKSLATETAKGKDDQKSTKQDNKKKRQALLNQLKEVNKEVEGYIKEKKKITASIPKLEDRGIKEETKKRDDVYEELSKVRAQIPESVVSFDKALQGDLVGPQGSTIKCMQEEFGVMLNIRSDDGKLVIRGSKESVEQCKDAVGQLLQNAKDNSVKATMKFDPNLFGDLIGKRGSTAANMRKQSGARINIDESGDVEIIGNETAVAKAKEMVQEFLDNAHKQSITYQPDMVDIVFGRGGRTVRSIQDESGCKIKVEKSENTIIFTGKKANCDAAQKKFEQLLKDFQGGGVEMKISDDIAGLIFGRGAKLVNKMEEDTGTLIKKQAAADNAKAGASVVLRIRGSKQNISAAQKAISECIKENAKANFEVAIPAPLVPVLLKTSKDAEGKSILCPLDQIRKDTGCQTVRLDRRALKVIVGGKKQQAEECTAKLKAFLQANQVHSTEVIFEPILFGYLTRRSGKNDSVLQTIRKETGCDDSIVDKANSTVSFVAMEKSVTTKASDDLKAIIAEKMSELDTYKLPGPSVIGAIIGTGGKTIMNITKESKCEVLVDRSKNKVDLMGSPEAIAKAKEMLDEVIKGETKEIVE